MKNIINDKTIVVTGGANGIGFDIAKKFLINGAKLAILLDIDEDQGEEAVVDLGNKAIFMKCDVSKDLDDIFKKITSTYTIDVLVNSAGIGDESLPKRMIDINFTAAVEWSMKFWNYMKDNNISGSIINISSIFGLRVTPICPVYHGAKFGLAGFSRSLGHDYWYKESGVRVITICPGHTETNMTANARKRITNSDFIKISMTLERQEAGAVGDAAVEVFQKASSGSVWVVEGGKLKQEIM